MNKAASDEESGDDSRSRPLLARADVPVFQCRVYVKRLEGGRVRARVANLSGLEFEAAGERDALLRVVREFKASVGERLERGEEIQWLDPPVAMEAGEVARLVAVHL